MGIEQLDVTGFRSLRDIQWRPGRLNILIGPNGSGKSNLLQALELIRSSAVEGLRAWIVRSGGMSALLWDERAGSLIFRVAERIPFSGDRLTYEIGLEQVVGTGSYRVGRETLSRDGVLEFVRMPSGEVVYRDQPTGFGLAEDARFLPGIHHYTQAGPAERTLQVLLANWAIYQDLRVDREAPLRQAAVARYEKLIDADGQNLIPVLHTLYTGNRDFETTVDDAMRAAFGADYEKLVFPPAADQRVQLRVRWRSLKTEQSAANLSDGILRFLLLLAILANPEPGDLIAIDEPETGLHPGVFPILAELAVQAAEKTQVIFTTHSPQFLDAFSEPPTTTVCEWVDGATKLSVLDGEELARWLEHYSLGAIFRSGELEALA